MCALPIPIISARHWVFVLIGCAVMTGCKKPKPAPPAPTVVRVMTVQPREVPIYKEWIGTLEGYVNAQIRAQVVGYLREQGYAEGGEVHKGDLLFQIDPRPFEAALSQAKSKLAQDQAQESRTRWDVERYAPLAKQNAISQQEYNDAVQSNLAAQAQVKADQAAVEAVQLNLEFTRITSPIDGLAGIAQAQIGDLVGPNGPVLTTVSTIDPIKVYFTASEQAYIAYRRQYTNVTARTAHEQELDLQLILADGSLYPLTGKFSFAGREVNPTTGTIQLVGTFPNPGYTLRPGQFARVHARTQMRPDTIVVPQRAVSELQGSYQVAVVDDQNKAHLQTVTVGDQVGSDWIIEKGLRPGQRIVVEGTQKVKEGATVQPEPFVAEARQSLARTPSQAVDH
jgi:membrane fusion protein (multidrug efflux system)